MQWEKINTTDLSRALFQEPSLTHAITEPGIKEQGLTPAAVLFPVIKRPQHLTVLFTKRTATLKDHPGQISFPGGRVEPEDGSLSHTALREAQEEISLPASVVQIMGYLPEYRTITGYSITPVMGLITPPFELLPDPSEVAEIFEVPLSFILDPANHQQHHIEYKERRRSFHAIDYNGHFIWGATAGIIVSLSTRIAALKSCA